MVSISIHDVCGDGFEDVKNGWEAEKCIDV